MSNQDNASPPTGKERRSNLSPEREKQFDDLIARVTRKRTPQEYMDRIDAGTARTGSFVGVNAPWLVTGAVLLGIAATSISTENQLAHLRERIEQVRAESGSASERVVQLESDLQKAPSVKQVRRDLSAATEAAESVASAQNRYAETDANDPEVVTRIYRDLAGRFTSEAQDAEGGLDPTKGWYLAAENGRDGKYGTDVYRWEVGRSLQVDSGDPLVLWECRDVKTGELLAWAKATWVPDAVATDAEGEPVQDAGAFDDLVVGVTRAGTELRGSSTGGGMEGVPQESSSSPSSSSSGSSNEKSGSTSASSTSPSSTQEAK